MSRPIGAGRGVLGLLLLAILIVLVALPALAAEPSGSPAASADPTATAAPTPAPTAVPTPTAASTAAPTPAAAPTATRAPAATAEPDEDGESANPDKPAKEPKGAKAPENDVTITGTVATRTDADGQTEYTMAVGGKTLVLEAGPRWFFGNDHPLKAFVGKRVTITGSQRVGEDDVDVEAVNGTRLRAPGKPPWAGGWKRVGERHPGWTQEKWDRWQTKATERAKRFGTDCFPPGQCKEKPNKGGAAPDDVAGPDDRD
jgi:hypothetical protein